MDKISYIHSCAVYNILLICLPVLKRIPQIKISEPVLLHQRGKNIMYLWTYKKKTVCSQLLCSFFFATPNACTGCDEFWWYIFANEKNKVQEYRLNALSFSALCCYLIDTHTHQITHLQTRCHPHTQSQEWEAFKLQFEASTIFNSWSNENWHYFSLHTYISSAYQHRRTMLLPWNCHKHIFAGCLCGLIILIHSHYHTVKPTSSAHKSTCKIQCNRDIQEIGGLMARLYTIKAPVYAEHCSVDEWTGLGFSCTFPLMHSEWLLSQVLIYHACLKSENKTAVAILFCLWLI